MCGIRYMWYMSSFYSIVVKMLCLCEGHGENET